MLDMTSTAAPAPQVPSAQRIKIWFRFDPKDLFPEMETEGLWGSLVSDDTARIENVPFLQDGVAEGDIVRFVTLDGVHWCQEKVSASGNCVVRVLPVPSGPLGRSAQAVRDKLAPFGMGGEVFSEELPLIAFNVPAEANLRKIKKFLARGGKQDWWHYEVGCATDAWHRA
jgi:hypothetical protein